MQHKLECFFRKTRLPGSLISVHAHRQVLGGQPAVRGMHSECETGLHACGSSAQVADWHMHYTVNIYFAW